MTDSAGCTGTANVVVNENALPTANVTSANQYTCSGNNANLSAALTGTGPWLVQWSDESTPDTVTVSPATRTVNPTVTTTYTVTSLTDSGTGCSAVAGGLTGSTTVTMNPITATAASYNVIEGTSLKIPIAALISGYASVPANDTITLAGVGTDGHNLTTTGGSNLVVNSTYILYTNSLTTGQSDTFTYTAVNPTGCTAQNTITVTAVAASGQQTGSINVTNGVVILTFYGVPGSQYDIQGSPDTILPWTNIPGSPFTAYTNGIINATDSPAGSSEYYQLTTP